MNISKLLRSLNSKYNKDKYIKILKSIPIKYDVLSQSKIITTVLKIENDKKIWFNDIFNYPCTISDILINPNLYIFKYKGFKCYMFRISMSWMALIDVTKLKYMIVDDNDNINIKFINKLIDNDININYVNNYNNIIGFTYKYDINIHDTEYMNYEHINGCLKSIICQFTYLFNL
uniref:Uncharacterized protein n=1 Tax=Pithovirus LCPAC102 TaxID=2506587 RepID=A0A481Z401_9VIRU|nr:MAG: hypothetical protein LCPAC102_00970 [Pithovirus LCPAC102]